MTTMEFSTLIRDKRKALGLTQNELAKKLHVTNKAVSRWETGKGYPDIEMIPLLSKTLMLSYEELLDGNAYILSCKKKKIKRCRLWVIITTVCCLFIAITAYNNQQVTRSKYTGIDLLASEDLIGSDMYVSSTTIKEHIGTSIGFIGYNSYMRFYILETLQIDTWKEVGKEEIDIVFMPNAYRFQFNDSSNSGFLVAFSICQLDDKIEIYVQDKENSNSCIKYEANIKINEDILEHLSSYPYGKNELTDFFQHHAINNTSSVLKEIDKEIITGWSREIVEDTTTLLNKGHCFVNIGAKNYFVLTSNKEDCQTMDASITDGKLSISITGKQRLYYQSYVHIYEIIEIYIGEGELIYNGNKILPTHYYEKHIEY